MQTSSSSLAHALGPLPPPPSTERVRPPPPPPSQQKVYPPSESRAFFNTFLEQKTREMNVAARMPPPTTSPIKTSVTKVAAVSPVKGPPNSSPDPLSVIANSSPVPVTPRKRKPVVEIESPSIKRMQTLRKEYVEVPKFSKSSTSSVTNTPSSSSMTSIDFKAPTPTPKRPTLIPYVSVPPPRSPWLTPSSRKNGFVTPAGSSKRIGKSRMNDTPDDLGGYGPEDGFGSPIKRRSLTDSIRSSARRTGDRDDRGM